MPFEFERLEIPDVILVRPRVFPDERGWFAETYKRTAFTEHGIPHFVQDNQSCSERGVLRGMHYQIGSAAQGKLVTAVVGAVFDVAVDLRAGSPTFSRWVGRELLADDKNMLYIPPGFAHGFCVLSDMALLSYKVTTEYAPDLERGLLWNDADVGVEWPVATPVVSDRDARLPRLRDLERDLAAESWQ